MPKTFNKSYFCRSHLIFYGLFLSDIAQCDLRIAPPSTTLSFASDVRRKECQQLTYKIDKKP